MAAKMSSEMNKLTSRRTSKSCPRTSARSPRRACSTRPSTVAVLEMVVSAMAASVGLAHAAHEAVAEDVQTEREEEEDDAHEVEAGHGEAGAPHLVGAGGERGHGGGHREAALQRVGLQTGGVAGAAGDEHDHRLADGPRHGEDHGGDDSGHGGR